MGVILVSNMGKGAHNGQKVAKNTDKNGAPIALHDDVTAQS